MKTYFVLIAIFFSLSSYAYDNYLKIFVIKPIDPIDWSSPRSLSITSGINSALREDFAPIGHFAVEVNCAASNEFGVHRILTGMERKDKAASQKIVMDKKLGLGSLTYDFEGALQSRQTVRSEIRAASLSGRLKTLLVPTSPERCQQMLDFVGSWIRNGSFRIYGGGKNTEQGQGAGCADFAMTLFKIATDLFIPEWHVKIKVPTRLIGDGENKKIPFISLADEGSWAKPDEESMDFTIADTNLVTDWIEERVSSNNYIFSEHIFHCGYVSAFETSLEQALTGQISKLKPHKTKAFRYSYLENVDEQAYWDMIENHWYSIF